MSWQWDSDIEWLLRASEASLGVRGSLAAVVASLERGGAGGTPVTDPHTDQQLVDVRRQRRLLARWNRLNGDDQTVLVVLYQRRPPRMQVGGNTHAWPSGSEMLGDVCAVALWGAWRNGSLGELLEAMDRRKTDPLSRAKLAAERLVISAHNSWRQTDKLEAENWLGAI